MTTTIGPSLFEQEFQCSLFSDKKAASNDRLCKNLCDYPPFRALFKEKIDPDEINGMEVEVRYGTYTFSVWGKDRVKYSVDMADEADALILEAAAFLSGKTKEEPQFPSTPVPTHAPAPSHQGGPNDVLIQCLKTIETLGRQAQESMKTVAGTYQNSLEILSGQQISKTPTTKQKKDQNLAKVKTPSQPRLDRSHFSRHTASLSSPDPSASAVKRKKDHGSFLLKKRPTVKTRMKMR